MPSITNIHDVQLVRKHLFTFNDITIDIIALPYSIAGSITAIAHIAFGAIATLSHHDLKHQLSLLKEHLTIASISSIPYMTTTSVAICLFSLVSTLPSIPFCVAMVGSIIIGLCLCHVYIIALCCTKLALYIIKSAYQGCVYFVQQARSTTEELVAHHIDQRAPAPFAFEMMALFRYAREYKHPQEIQHR